MHVRAPIAGMSFVLVVDLSREGMAGSCICIFNCAKSRGQCLGFGHVSEPVQRGSWSSHSGWSNGKYGEKVLAIRRVSDVNSIASSDVKRPFVDIMKVKTTLG